MNVEGVGEGASRMVGAGTGRNGAGAFLGIWVVERERVRMRRGTRLYIFGKGVVGICGEQLLS